MQSSSPATTPLPVSDSFTLHIHLSGKNTIKISKTNRNNNPLEKQQQKIQPNPSDPVPTFNTPVHTTLTQVRAKHLRARQQAGRHWEMAMVLPLAEAQARRPRKSLRAVRAYKARG
jgi:hypothetical protein